MTIELTTTNEATKAGIRAALGVSATRGIPVFANTAAGLAGTVDGDQFQVFVGDEYIVYRRDSASLATEVARYPAAEYVFDRLDDGPSSLSGYAFAVLDQSGRPAISVTLGGAVEMPGTPTFNALSERKPALSTIMWGVTDQDGRLAFGINSAGNLVSKGRVVDLEAIAETSSKVDAALDASQTVDCWGDSLTHGNTAGVTVPYPVALASLLPGRTVNNRGLSGRTSLQIATAFGAVPSILTVANNTIPASGAVSVTLTENGNFSTKSNFSPRQITGTLFGIHGTLSVAWNSVDPNLAGVSTFTRTTAGAATVIPNRTPFIPDTGGWEANTIAIWSGRNDIISGFSNDAILANIAAMVEFQSQLRKRFVVLSVVDQASEPSGSAVHTQILALNYELSRRYPRNFVDVRKILVNSYNPALPNDVTAFSQDRVPPSLQQDGLHLNNAGYAIVAQAVANFLTAKGW